MDADDDVEELKKLDIARILIRTSWKPLIQHTVNVHIQGELYEVNIVEESGKSCANCQRRQWSDHSSSDEILSDESEDGEIWEDIPTSRWTRMQQQNKEADYGGIKGGASSLGSLEEPRRLLGGNTPRDDNLQEVWPSPKQGRAEGEDRMAVANTVANTHVRATQVTAEIPVDIDTPEGTRDASQTMENIVKPTSPENSVGEAEGDEPLRVTTGLCDGPELGDKAVDCQVISKSVIMQREDAPVQRHGRVEQGTVQLPSNQKEGLMHKGSCVPGEKAGNNHERGKGGTDMNVEEKKRGFKIEEPHDKRMGWEVDEAFHIHTPTNIFHPQTSDLNSPSQAQCSSWQVYSRKGRGKKKLAHGSAGNSLRDTIAYDITSISSQHQKMADNQAERQNQ